MAKENQKRSKSRRSRAKKLADLPAGPKAKNVKGGIVNRWVKLGTVVDLYPYQ